jgi:predicted ester cyclase
MRALRFPTTVAIAGPAIVLLAAAACSEPAPPPPPPPPPPAVKTAQERMQLFQDCWGYFNNKNYTQMATCYAPSINAEVVDSAQPKATTPAQAVENMRAEETTFPDRRGEPRYLFANGNRLAAIVLFTGTNSGPMPGPDGKPMPATNKTIGLLTGQTLELDANGAAATREAFYLEEGTMAAQLGLNPNPAARKAEKATGAPPVVVIAKNDATEASNIAIVRAGYDAMAKHDVKAMTAMMADDAKMIDISQPADMDKKAAEKSLQEFIKGFPDITPNVATIWGAGDYVIVEGSVSGTNTGPLPSMGLKATGKKVSVRFMEVYHLQGGKVKTDWLFFNGAAFANQLGLK